MTEVPELPEVETIRRSLAPKLIGRRFLAIRSSGLPLRRRVAGSSWKRLLGAREIQRVSRRGKYLVLDCRGGWSLLVHLGMSGRLLLVEGGSGLEPHVHWRGLLDDGRELRLRDPRRFGSVLPWPTASLQVASPLARLGREPLDPPVTAPELEALARGSRRAIKDWLLDSTRVAGVGNIYATEALFRARIDPRKPVDRLSHANWRQLAAALVEVLESAIEAGGTTLQDFQDGCGRPGTFQRFLQAYGRAGQPCYRCGRILRSFRIGGRSTVACPRCQRIPDGPLGL